jgi:hypothetical protein
MSQLIRDESDRQLFRARSRIRGHYAEMLIAALNAGFSADSEASQMPVYGP